MLRRPKSLPRSSGVYIFQRGKTPLYIGKAANLKARLASYFTKADGRTPKIERMLQESTRLEIIETVSEIEALIKEAELIKKYRPKYNLLMRDDKSYFYAAVTEDAFPRIYITHQPRQEIRNPRLRRGFGRQAKSETRNKSKIQNSKYVSKFKIRASNFRSIGPFTSGTALRGTLKLLRRIFPYCTCKAPHKRPCLNSEIGRCPGYCCTTLPQIAKRKSQSARHEYRKNIRNIIAVLGGKKTRLTAELKRRLKEAAKTERYEEAAKLRDQIRGLEDIFAHRSVVHERGPSLSWPEVEAKLSQLLGLPTPIHRIEGYDIANIGADAATGAMVVFYDGKPDKSQYRKFRIKTIRGISDVAMLREVLRRRFGHPEWPLPEFVVIDGGKPQLGAALAVVRRSTVPAYPYDRKNTPDGPGCIVTALAKREEMLFTENGRAIALKRGDPAILHLFQRIRDEAHRFARAYHHALRKRNYAEAS